eukprot:COSAG06_NODE_1939_length_8024_cov_83.073186_6_plen_990_part_00
MAARELRIAAQNGDCGKLRELLDGGGASVVNERTKVMNEETGKKFETTALIIAVVYSQHAAVELLLEHNANPNMADSCGFTPLMTAANGGRLPILRTLLDRKAIAIDAVYPETGCTAFHLACFQGHVDCAVELARCGCDMTLRIKHGETGKQLAERMKHTAVLEGLRALVAEQLQTTQQSNSRDNAASDNLQKTNAHELLIAARHGDCDKLRELLDGGGASVVNQRTEVTGKKTGEKLQTTALLEAAALGYHAAVELLLENGADPSLAGSRGDTPLMMAAFSGHPPILRTLLDRKAIAIDAVGTETGCTAFHGACFQGHVDCAVELARRGCDMMMRTKHGETGKDMAERMKHPAVLGGLRALVAEEQGNSNKTYTQTAGVDNVRQIDEDYEQKAAKKAAANRKKKDMKKAKKAAAQQQLPSQIQMAQPYLQTELEPEPADAAKQTTEPEQDTDSEDVVPDAEADIELGPGLQATAEDSASLPAQAGEENKPAPTIAIELRNAAAKGDCGKMRELLHGGGASIVNERIDVIDTETGVKVQVSALIAAVKYGQHAVVDLLLEHNADPNRADSLGCTPLMHAAGGGCLSILRTLLDRKATAIDAVGIARGWTAFHCACITGNAECAVELARRGCNMGLRDKQGLTGLDLARQEGNRLLIKRCKAAQKLAQRNVQQQSGSSNDSSAAATFPDSTAMPRLNEDEERAKAAKKAAANRKKKERKKAKKAAAQRQLLSQAAEPVMQAEPEPEADAEPETDADAEEPAEPEAVVVEEPEAELGPIEPEADTEPEPELDEHTQQLQALAELGVQQWSAAQVLEWVALADLPPESIPAAIAAMESLDVDGRDFLDLTLRMLHRKLAKHGGVQDAEALAKQVIEQRDALLLPGDIASKAVLPVPKRPNSPECPICMEPFCDDESGQYVPRILTNCGHTVCHGCIAKLLSQGAAVKKNKKTKKGAKACKCPSCEVVTEVEGGDATKLFRNYALTSAVEEED